MKRLHFIPIFLLFISTLSFSQTMDGDWSVAYALTDDAANGTGLNTISVAVVEEDAFIGLVRRASASTYYLVGYRNADSTSGRLGSYPYNASELKTLWVNFFDQKFLNDAKGITHWKDNIVLVANNDEEHNLLAFELGQDSIASHSKRLSTGANPIWAIHADKADHVYVTQDGDDATAPKVLVYQGPDGNNSWSSGYLGNPIQEIELPVTGTARGITTNDDGSYLYVSTFEAEKIFCYKGSPETGYTLNNDFNFDLNDTLKTEADTLYAGNWEVELMPEKNILFVSTHFDFQGGTGYQYGRIYAVNPNTAEILDTIDVAEWNYSVNDAYDNRNQQNGISSGYTSPYAVDFDENNNLYSVSFFGWTVDKWSYSGEFPTIELGATGIELADNNLPEEFSLSQNYPNPFNPSTTINFSIAKSTNIELSIYTITGELVGKLIDSQNYASGNYNLTFNASNLASGTYIYQLKADNVQFTKKMMLLK
ncbi:MAG: T9SS type A sorting domain-containing protein [Melioribacteraceae bacterium]|nr:T9SS type A sorting domain-containing protein [Melioribacteraceae bacterium]